MLPQVVTELATQTLLQKLGVVEEAHDSPQFIPSQVGVVPLPAGPAGHGVHRFPQVLTLELSTHWPLHSWYPGLHCTPHEVPLQVAMPKAGDGHGVHIEPHVKTLAFDTHCVPHWWKPLAQVYWQAPFTHWGLAAPAGGVQVAQVAPHAVMDSGRHWFPQRTKPGLHSKSQAGAPPGEALRHTETPLAGA